MVLAKVLNLWDRSYGYLAMTVLATLGLVLSAACKDIYTYCAAQVSLHLLSADSRSSTRSVSSA
jgi:hypothetical protein